MLKSIKQYSTNISPKQSILPIFKALDINPSQIIKGCYNGKWFANGPVITSINPSTNLPIAQIQTASESDMQNTIKKVKQAQKEWKLMPLPKRAEILSEFKYELLKERNDIQPFSNYKQALGLLVSLEMGKIKNEGLGEIQEVIDMFDYASGLGRSQNGSIMPSERKGHLMMEQWHPLGIVGVISAFNYPLTVYAWNMALALVCGNGVLWKPAPTGTLSAIAMIKIIQKVLERNGVSPALCSLVSGGASVGQQLVDSPDVQLVSFTGSTHIGGEVGLAVQRRFGKSLLELGGNNAMIIHEDANLELAIKTALLDVVETTGQRCTSLRRLYVHESVSEQVIEGLVKGFTALKDKIGDPLSDGVLIGPLHTKSAVAEYQKTISAVKQEGSQILFGNGLKPLLSHSQYHSQSELEQGNFVLPVMTRVQPDSKLLQHESFVPIVHVITYKTLQEAIQYNNQVKQGLSSTLFTQNIENINEWLGPNGSDCGIANVNCSTSAVEVGVAFGGEKETGGGRTSGSDSWKQYCRRQTNMINFGK